MKEGSAEEVNSVIREAIAEAKTVIDELVEMVAASGYPPLTEPITLKDLLAMPQPQAVQFLRDELKRTMIDDPVTGDKRPSPKIVEMAVAYMEAREGYDG